MKILLTKWSSKAFWRYSPRYSCLMVAGGTLDILCRDAPYQMVVQGILEILAEILLPNGRRRHSGDTL